MAFTGPHGRSRRLRAKSAADECTLYPRASSSEVTEVTEETAKKRRNGETEIRFSCHKLPTYGSFLGAATAYFHPASNRTGRNLRGAGVALLQLMLVDDQRLNTITGTILAAAIEVHRVLGPGLLESIYIACLQVELAAHGLRFVVQRAVPITYKESCIEACYRVDLIVEDMVVVEVKSIEKIAAVHKSQVLTYLGVSGCPAVRLDY